MSRFDGGNGRPRRHRRQDYAASGRDASL